MILLPGNYKLTKEGTSHLIVKKKIGSMKISTPKLIMKMEVS